MDGMEQLDPIQGKQREKWQNLLMPSFSME
jgi:hypothetical protein